MKHLLLSRFNAHRETSNMQLINRAFHSSFCAAFYFLYVFLFCQTLAALTGWAVIVAPVLAREAPKHLGVVPQRGGSPPHAFALGGGLAVRAVLMFD